MLKKIEVGNKIKMSGIGSFDLNTVIFKLNHRM